MRIFIFLSFAATVFLVADANAECRYGKKVVTGPAGKTIVACLDGKYKTCIYDSQRAGYTYEHAKDYCGRLREQGRVK